MVGLLLLLGGTGSRFGSALPKQFIPYRGKAVFAATTSALLNSLPINRVVLSVTPEYLSLVEFLSPLTDLRKTYPQVHFEAVAGGASRHLSFRAAFQALRRAYPQVEKILVHDANRPFLSEKFLTQVQHQLQRLAPDTPCLIPGLPLAESVCRATHGRVNSYENREALFRVQTPQLLLVSAVEQALASEAAKFSDWTDEGSFMLAAGQAVATFAGDAANVKITYRHDLPDGEDVFSGGVA